MDGYAVPFSQGHYDALHNVKYQKSVVFFSEARLHTSCQSQEGGLNLTENTWNKGSWLF